jgi:histidine triad (HIT) family protein
MHFFILSRAVRFACPRETFGLVLKAGISFGKRNAMAKTIFQKIIDREIPARIEYEDEQCIVIHDIQPQAPVHLLIIPKKVIPRVEAATPADQVTLGHLFLVAGQLAKKLLLENGFRLVVNNGPDAAESVPHLHVHLLAKRKLNWPPG